MYKCICACVGGDDYMCAYAHTRMDICWSDMCICVYGCTFVRMSIRMCGDMHMYVYIYTHIYVCIHTPIQSTHTEVHVPLRLHYSAQHELECILWMWYEVRAVAASVKLMSRRG